MNNQILPTTYAAACMLGIRPEHLAQILPYLQTLKHKDTEGTAVILPLEYYTTRIEPAPCTCAKPLNKPD